MRKKIKKLVKYFIIMNLELKKFDMKKITFKPNENQGPVIVLIGRRDTGKSFLVRDLLYYHQDCHDAKSQGWLSRVSKSTGRALYRHSEHSKTWRWEKPKVPEDSEDNIFRGGRKTKRKKKKQTKRPKKKQTKRRKTNKRKKKKKSKKRRK